MRLSVDNLYEHADGGFYCLLAPEAPMKHPVSGEWVPGVVYTGTDGLMRSTTRERWDERFEPVAEYAGDDESVVMMIRRCNPGNSDFDFIRVFESWHESELSITSAMLELAVAAVLRKWQDSVNPGWDTEMGQPGKAEITIRTEDLQSALQTFDIKRVPIPHGFIISITRDRVDLS